MASIIVFLGVFIGISPNAFAANKYPDVNRQTWFNNVADNLSTLGEDPQDARQIKQDRRKMRKMVRQHEVDRAKRKATQERIKQEQQIILDKIYPG